MLLSDTKKPVFQLEIENRLAGAEGLEPSTKVLETHVLPLHHTPNGFIIFLIQTYVNHFWAFKPDKLQTAFIVKWLEQL